MAPTIEQKTNWKGTKIPKFVIFPKKKMEIANFKIPKNFPNSFKTLNSCLFGHSQNLDS
jgi:hypothetical protein